MSGDVGVFRDGMKILMEEDEGISHIRRKLRQILYLQKLKISIGRLNLDCEKIEAILPINVLAIARTRNAQGHKHTTVSEKMRNHTTAILNA
jgi:hypothetical protein